MLLQYHEKPNLAAAGSPLIRSHFCQYCQCCPVSERSSPFACLLTRRPVRPWASTPDQCLAHRGGQPAEMLRQVAQRLAGTARRGISTSAICREGEDKGPKGMLTCWS